MHLCTQTARFDGPLEETLTYLDGLGIESLDLKADPDVYLDDDDAQAELRTLLDEYDMEISVLGAGGSNPLHPDEETADEADTRLRETIRLADQLGVDTVTSFSGLPAGAPGDSTPNWIVCPAPSRGQADSYEYQWDIAIDYWSDLGAFADEHDVDVAIEIHVRTLANSPTTMVRLREEASGRIGGYVDPAHLTIQGIDPSVSIRYLADHEALFHFEASDVKVYDDNRRLKGLWDMTPMSDRLGRPWSFCTVGYGHDDEYWRDIIATLNLVGYDGAISIQQLHTPEPFREGLERAASFLDDMLL